MRAMVLERQRRPLELKDLPKPRPAGGQVLIRVSACGVCRTDLHVVDGDLTEPKLPLVPGHQIVGTVAALGERAAGFKPGDRVGVPWLGWTCGECRYCRSGAENLCDHARYTGYQMDGGFAEYCVADERFCFPIPKGYPDIQAAPLLCAGLIGYRSLKMTECPPPGRTDRNVCPTGEAPRTGRADRPAAAGGGVTDRNVCPTGGLGVKRLGFYGFGAAAHILVQVARYQGREVFAFTRPGDEKGREFARKMGAVWAGGSDETPPAQLDAAIIFAPVGELVPAALQAVRKGGVVVCAGIHMSDIPSFEYSLLWGERVVRSVANLTRADGEEFLELAPRVPVKTEVHRYPLEKANEALADLREGRFTGAAVIVMEKGG